VSTGILSTSTLQGCRCPACGASTLTTDLGGWGAAEVTTGLVGDTPPGQIGALMRRAWVDFATTGDADYHLRVVVRDMDAYNKFLDEFMFRIPGIRHVRTNVILKEIKTGVALPF